MDESNPYASPANIEANGPLPVPSPPVGAWSGSAASALGSLALGLTFMLSGEVVLYTLRSLVPEVSLERLFFACRFGTVAGGVWAITGFVGLGVVPRDIAARGPLYAALALMSIAVLFQGIALGLRFLSPQSLPAAWLFLIGSQLGLFALLFAGKLLGSLAQYFNQSGLVGWYRIVSVGVVSFVIADVLYWVYAWLSQRLSMEMVAISKIVIVSAMWTIYGVYLRLALGLRSVLRRQAVENDGEARPVSAEPPPGAAWIAERPDSLKRVAQGMMLGIVNALIAGAAVWIESWGFISPELFWHRQIIHAFWLFVVVGQALKLLAAQRWTAIPEEAKARELAQAAAATALLAAFFATTQLLVDWKVMQPLELPAELIRIGLEIVWTVLALNCLKRICTFIGRSDLARQAHLLMIVAVALGALYAVTYGMASYAADNFEFLFFAHRVVQAVVFYADVAMIFWSAAIYAGIRATLLQGEGQGRR